MACLVPGHNQNQNWIIVLNMQLSSPKMLAILFRHAVLCVIWKQHCRQWFNSLRLRQNGRCFADDTFKRIFLNENVRIAIKISLKFVPRGPINNIPALVQIMAWHRPGDKPLSEPVMVSLLTHICITRPQWVNSIKTKLSALVTFVTLGPV